MNIINKIKSFINTIFQQKERKYMLSKTEEGMPSKINEMMAGLIQDHNGELSFSHEFDSISEVVDYAHKKAFDCLILEYIKDNVVSNDLLREFACYVDWDHISKYQKLSEEFILEFEEFINWNIVFINQRLSKRFMLEHAHKTDIKKREEQSVDWLINPHIHIQDGTNFQGYITLDGNNINNTDLLIGGHDHTVTTNLTTSDNQLTSDRTVTIGSGDVVQQFQLGGQLSTDTVIAGNGITYAADYSAPEISFVNSAGSSSEIADITDSLQSLKGDIKDIKNLVSKEVDELEED